MQNNLLMMSDLFCVPEATLLTDVTQAFVDHSIKHASRYLFADVHEAIQHVHSSGLMHKRCVYVWSP